MFKRTVIDGSGDFRDRSLAVAISVALHVLAFGWIWLGGGQVGIGGGGIPGEGNGDGMSADFLAPGEFRQRIETVPTPSTPIPAELEINFERTEIEVPDAAVLARETPIPLNYEESPNPNFQVTALATQSAVAEPADAGLAQEGNIAGGSKEDGLRMAYMEALRAAIRAHWHRQGVPLQCPLKIMQSAGGVVQSAIAGDCSLAPEDRRLLEAAVLMAQPLPYEGYESVFREDVELKI